MLPVELPDVPDYSPKTYDPDDASSEPEPPLSRVDEWVHVELDLGDGRGTRRYRRETNTMPNWAGSCWYYLRYLDPANRDAFVDPDNEAYWMGPRPEPVAGAAPGTRDPGGVDLYVGGVEHAVLHLLYARFWHKVLYDLGHLSSDEPFRTYFTQGYIQASAYSDGRGQSVEAERGRGARRRRRVDFTWQGAAGHPRVRQDRQVAEELRQPRRDVRRVRRRHLPRLRDVLGPLELSKPWETRAVVGSQRFLQRLWRNVDRRGDRRGRRRRHPDGRRHDPGLHHTIDAVRTDYAGAGLQHRHRQAHRAQQRPDQARRRRAPRGGRGDRAHGGPVAPHIAEELWARLGHEESLVHADFPVADPALLVEEHVTCVVQIKGKVRDRVEVPADITEDALRELALASAKVQAAVPDGIRTVIVRAPKLVNVVPA